MTHDTTTCKLVRSHRARDRKRTHGAARAHQQEENDLLPWREGAEVDARKPADGDRAHAVEERVDVADVVLAVTGVKDSRGDKGGEGAVWAAVSRLSSELMIAAHKKRMWTL